jgi:hypothetical protein
VGQLAAFIQQRIRHVYRRQRPSEGGGNKLLDVSVPYFQMHSGSDEQEVPQ